MKKVLAMLLTLVMALSICVPAFAGPSFDPSTLPPPEEIVNMVKEMVSQKIEAEIDKTFVALGDYMTSYPIPVEPELAPMPEAPAPLAPKPTKPVKPVKGDTESKAAFNMRMQDYNEAMDNYSYALSDWQYARDEYNDAVVAYNKDLKNWNTVTKPAYEKAYAKWENDCKEWSNNLLIGKAMSKKAAKVALTNAYNQGTFTSDEVYYAKEALRKDINFTDTKLIPAKADLVALQTKLAATQNELVSSKAELVSLREQKEDLYANRNALQNQYNGLADKSSAEAKDLMKQINAINKQLKKITELNDTTIPTLKDEINSLKDSIVDKQENVDSLEATRATSQTLRDKIAESYRLTPAERELLKIDLKYLKENTDPLLGTGEFGAQQAKLIEADLKEQEKMTDKQYATVMNAIDGLSEPPTASITVSAPVYKLVVEAKDGKAVVDALTEMGIPLKLMNKAIDIISGKKIILDSVAKLGKAEVANILANGPQNDGSTAPDTPEEEKPGSGLSDFLNNLFGKLKGDKDGNVDNSENGMKDPTGDIAIYSVLGLAAAAGVAIVVAKKRKIK